MIELFLKYVYFFILPTFFLVFGLRLIVGKRTLPQRFLGLYFIVFFIRNLSAYQLAEKSTSYYAHFQQIQSPIHYILGPLGFLFVVYALKPYRKLRWFDLLHFLPFTLHLIELLPFFFSPIEVKLRDLELSQIAGSYINYPTLAGIIPIPIHASVKSFLAISYLIASIIVWFRFVKKQDSIFYLNNSILLKWIGADLLLKVISLVLIILQFVGIFNVHNTSTFSSNDLLMFMDVLVNFLFFLIYPKLLNGAIFESLSVQYFEKQNTLDNQVSKNQKEDLPINRTLRELQILMEVEAPYLDENFSIKILADQLRMTERNVSKLIHDHFQMSFPDYVGNWRLNYLKKMLKNETDSSNITIEKMAEKSGFGSRQALYKVVQRLHQTTPNKFFETRE